MHSLESLWALVLANDRRYAELEEKRVEALAIARGIQDYKDEKANQLREQISGERGHYATKDDLALLTERYQEAHKPLADFVTSEQAARAAHRSGLTETQQIIAMLAAVVIVTLGVLNYLDLRSPSHQPVTTTVTVPTVVP